MEKSFDRAVEDIGNVIKLEHVNVTIPDQRLATLFYVSGLGLTRDPYLMTSDNNMWVNVGTSQFHMPTSTPQVLRGRVGIVVPDREALMKRLAAVTKRLEGTKFEYAEHNDHVDAVSPWGNRVRCHFPDAERFGRIVLGMPYVEFDVAPGSADGIARFYREVLKTQAAVSDDGAGRHARVTVGIGQDFIFRETDAPQPEYDRHHIQLYVTDFSGPHRHLLELGLITEESDQHQYRFEDIIDLASGKPLFKIEHEIRSMRHPLYARPLVNRNTAQSNFGYMPGFDESQWFMT